MEPFNDPACDFCANPISAHEIFIAPLVQAVAVDENGTIVDIGEETKGIAMDDQWAACGDCAKLIHAHDMEGLLQRVASMAAILYPDMQEAEFIEPLLALYEEIFRVLDISHIRCN